MRSISDHAAITCSAQEKFSCFTQNQGDLKAGEKKKQKMSVSKIMTSKQTLTK